jgi:hypothetical protein
MGPDGTDEPFHEGRMYAMMHIAIHDALNAIDSKYQPYADPGTSPDAPSPQRHVMFWKERPTAPRLQNKP